MTEETRTVRTLRWFSWLIIFLSVAVPYVIDRSWTEAGHFDKEWDSILVVTSISLLAFGVVVLAIKNAEISSGTIFFFFVITLEYFILTLIAYIKYSHEKQDGLKEVKSSIFQMVFTFVGLLSQYIMEFLSLKKHKPITEEGELCTEQIDSTEFSK